MQEALHFRPRLPTSPPAVPSSQIDPRTTGMLRKLPVVSGNQIDPRTTGMLRKLPEKVSILISENAVLVLGRRGCCMCHVMKRLLLGLGVNPTVHEIDEEEEETMEEELSGISGDHRTLLPAVFIGGQLVGGLDRLMAAHISGELVPSLKKAGALWL